MIVLPARRSRICIQEMLLTPNASAELLILIKCQTFFLYNAIFTFSTKGVGKIA